MKPKTCKRITLCLVILGSGTLPALPLACLSGAQQEGILGGFANLGTGLAGNLLVNTFGNIPVPINTGHPIIDTVLTNATIVWNNGVSYAVGLSQLTLNTFLRRQINFAIPDDPFPGP
jgi:hypothetical protein